MVGHVLVLGPWFAKPDTTLSGSRPGHFQQLCRIFDHLGSPKQECQGLHGLFNARTPGGDEHRVQVLGKAHLVETLTQGSGIGKLTWGSSVLRLVYEPLVIIML